MKIDLENFKVNLKNLGKRVTDLAENITNEEQTKNAFIMPFFQLLGYDVFNPLEFIPEFTADMGIKKGERIDYAIAINGEPQVLIECKALSENLVNHDSQLFRYFATLTAKFGILTNGKEYRFYTDLDKVNKMDAMPFLTIDITNIKDNQFTELSKFHKENFDVDNILSSASELKYISSFKTFFSANLATPSDEFVKYILSNIYEGKKNSCVIEQFKQG